MALLLRSVFGGRLPRLVSCSQRANHLARIGPGPQTHPFGSRSFFFLIFERSKPEDDSLTQAPAGPVNENLPDFSNLPTSEVSSLSPVADCASSLAEAGIGQSWGPISLAQNGLMEMYTTLGLPWWACLVTGVLCARVCMLPAQIWSLKTATRIHNNLPEEMELQRSMVKASQTRDNDLAIKTYQQLLEFQKKHNTYPLKPLSSAVYTLPITAVGVLSVLELCMLQPPLTGMATGGALWFPNLCIPDPLYMLPLGCGVMTMMNISSGAETGVTPAERFRKYIWTAVPVGVFGLCAAMPAGLQLYWVANVSLAMLVSRSVRSSVARRLLGVEEWKEHSKAALMRAEGTGTMSFVNDFRQSRRIAEAAAVKNQAELMRARWQVQLDQNTKFHEDLVASARLDKSVVKDKQMEDARLTERARKEDLQETELLYNEMEQPYMKRPASRTGPGERRSTPPRIT